MAIGDKTMTADELWRLPDDRLRHELVRGVLRTMSPSGGQHGWIETNISTPLDVHVRAHRLGVVFGSDTGFVLARNPDTVLAADVAFLRRERALELRDETRYLPGAPDLVVEVISPHDVYREVDAKVAEWLAAGARMVVVVNPRRRTVAAHRPGQPVVVLTEDDVLDGADVVPGWTLPVREIFTLPL